MNPNPDPTPPTPDPAAPSIPAPPPGAPSVPAEMNALVEYVRTQRQNVSYILLGLSVAFLVLTIWLGVKGFRTPATTAADQPAPTNPLEPEPPKAEVANPKKTSYLAGGIGTLFGFLVTAAAGVWFMVGLPSPNEAHQRTEARVIVLIVGGLLGFGLLLIGGWYFYLWSDSLMSWLDKGESKERLYVVLPLLMIAAGAGLVFMAVQPARAEERNNLMLRRLVYGSNFGMTVLLLFVVLIVANVVFAMKVPNKLDTTETGFYTISDTTKAFLSKLPEQVTAYAILPASNERVVNDIRQFLASCQEASDGKFRVRSISPATNQTELAALQAKYPRVSADALGVLLTVGEDEKRHVFIPADDLLDRDMRTGEVKGFAGEVRVMRELRFLAENEQRPVIYFTQGNGEMNISGGGGDTLLTLSAASLKTFLEKAYLDVRPLVFDLKTPKVPDDAAVLIVAEPQSPLTEGMVGAIRKYMTEPRPDNRKGKLIVLAGATPGPNDRGVGKTGLEGLLAEFNVRLGDKYVYTVPTERSPNYRSVLAAFTQAAAQNPVAQTMPPDMALRFQLPREVATLPNPGQFQATVLMSTVPGPFTWLEDGPITDLETTVRQLVDNETIQAQKNLSRGSRPVAAIVTEGGSGRVVVFGNAIIFSDRVADRSRGASSPITFDLMAATIDWLRDRPPLPTEIETKKYTEYQFPDPAGVDTTRLIWLPLGFSLLLVLGIGAGVWVIRRK